MNLIELGKTGLQVSEIGFGGIPIMPLSTGDAVDVVRHCYENGITFFDTANMFATSEEKIGIALAEVRNQVVIATKTKERHAEKAAAHIDLSLRQLKTDYIDIYQLHNVSNLEARRRRPGCSQSQRSRKNPTHRYIFTQHPDSLGRTENRFVRNHSISI
jgi:aryl-alcohol dehydrogenase-like predicted oxidoreductase